MDPDAAQFGIQLQVDDQYGMIFLPEPVRLAAAKRYAHMLDCIFDFSVVSKQLVVTSGLIHLFKTWLHLGLGLRAGSTGVARVYCTLLRRKTPGVFGHVRRLVLIGVCEPVGRRWYRWPRCVAVMRLVPSVGLLVCSVFCRCYGTATAC